MSSQYPTIAGPAAKVNRAIDACERPDPLLREAAMREAVQVGDALVDAAGATERLARGDVRRDPRRAQFNMTIGTGRAAP
jgi:hypothetical protein